jgi:hypothetical protein
MSWAPTSPITGQPQTGFTSPTYTHVADTAPDFNGKQIAVTALGGTQTGVTVHSVAAPFTITFVKPKTLRQIGTPDPVTGIVKSIPRNTYKAIARKGVLPLAGQPYTNMVATLTIDVPAGADLADPANIRACLSALFGAVVQQSAGVGDTAVSGIF